MSSSAHITNELVGDDDLLTEVPAMKFLERGEIRPLRDLRILEARHEKTDAGRWAFLFLGKDLKCVKACLETASQMSAHGYAKPAEGVLWFIQVKPQDDGTLLYDKVPSPENKGKLHAADLHGADRHTPSDHSEAIRTKFGITEDMVRRELELSYKLVAFGDKRKNFLWVEKSPTEMRGASTSTGDKPARSRLTPIYIYGCQGSRARLAFLESELRQYKPLTKATEDIDRERWRLVTELYGDVEAKSRAEWQEVSECAYAFSDPCLEGTKLQTKCALLPSSHKMSETQTIEALTPRTLFDGPDFVERYNADPAPFIQKIRDLIGTSGIHCRSLQEQLKKVGIVGTRMTRYIRQAGGKVKGGKRAKRYVLNESGAPTPVRKLQYPRGMNRKKTKTWLEQQLKDGPRLRKTLQADADKRKLRGLNFAFDSLGCKRCYHPKDENGAVGSGNWIIWYRGDMEEPTLEKKKELVAEYLRTNNECETRNPPATETDAGDGQRPADGPDVDGNQNAHTSTSAVGERSAKAKAGKTPSGPQLQAGLSKIDQAIVIKIRQPNLSMREIARRVGCSPSTLSDSSAFQRASEQAEGLNQGRAPKGSKGKLDGTIEAIDYRESESEDDE